MSEKGERRIFAHRSRSPAHSRMDRSEILWSNRFSPFSYKDDLEAPPKLVRSSDYVRCFGSPPTALRMRRRREYSLGKFMACDSDARVPPFFQQTKTSVSTKTLLLLRFFLLVNKTGKRMRPKSGEERKRKILLTRSRMLETDSLAE